MSTISSRSLLHIWRRALAILLISILIPSLGARADDPGPSQTPNHDSPPAPQWIRYSDNQWPISFEYLSNWSISEQVFEDNVRGIDLWSDLDGSITVTREENPANIVPIQWFEQSRGKYNDLVQIIGQMDAQGVAGVVVGLPNTCKSVPLLQAIVVHAGATYKFTYFGTGSKSLITELKRLIETLYFDGMPAGTSSLPDAYFKIPDAPTGITCEKEASGKATANAQGALQATSTGARMCSGAKFYIPTEGTLFSPYACFNSSFCSRYATGNSGEFGKPHSGLDIMGDQLPGVTPIYATGTGGVELLGDSAIRIHFDPPTWDKYWAYSTHMATGVKGTASYRDFRKQDLGTRVQGGAIIGYMGNYEAGKDWGTSNVHLHISYSDVPTDFWADNHPTADPTMFLNARGLKYLDGWNLRGPITCNDTVGSGAVDVYFLVDLTGSFSDDLPNFKSQAPGIIAALKAKNPDTRFGLGAFEDYPIPPFGDAASGDQAYRRVIDLTTDSTSVINAINGLTTRWGLDLPESQLAALFQAATGAGQDLSWAGYLSASIPAGQRASFRRDATKLILLWTDAAFHNPGDPGNIAYPGPSRETVASAIKAAGITCNVDVCASGMAALPRLNAIAGLDTALYDESGPRAMVIGISSGTDAMADLQDMAQLTGAIAPEGGIDCNADGIIDVIGGDPLVCGISSSGEGIGAAVVSLVRGVTPSTLFMTENRGTLRRVNQTTGETTIVGSLGTTSIDGLSSRPGDDAYVYGVEYSGVDASRLVKIDAVTGAVTRLPFFDGPTLGIPGPFAYAVAISPAAPNTAVIAGVSLSNGLQYYIWKADVDTGLVLGPAIPTSTWVQELAYNLDGSLLYGSDSSGRLVTVDTNTGITTLVGDPGLSDYIEGLAFRPSDGELFAIDAYDQDRLVRLDPANGSLLEVVGSVGAVGPYGLAFVHSTTPMRDIHVYIGGNNMHESELGVGGQISPSFPGTFDGAVHVTGDGPFAASERQIYGESFAETMGIPGDSLSTDYWFPWYDGQYMRTWIAIGAPDTNVLNALVDIYIHGVKMNDTPYEVAPGAQINPSFPGMFDGAVHVVSTNGQNIFTTERQIYGSSFAEAMGIAGSKLTTDYWFPWYDGQYMNTWIAIGAPDSNTEDALVDIYIGGVKMNETPYQIAAGGQINPSFPGTFDGAVHVVSTNGQKIFTTERQIYGSSFAEAMGIPGNTLTTDYWYSWYDGQYMRTWIAIGAPDTNTGNALVHIYIGGQRMNDTPYEVAPGGQVSPSFPGRFAGPVHVVSTNGQKIFTTERQIYGSSFAEAMGTPGDQLATDYWFPWYDGVYMRTWISIGRP